MKYSNDVAKFIKAGDFEQTDSGLLIHRAILAKGRYFHSVNGQDDRADDNLIPAEGILYLLGAGLGGVTAITTWYLALSNGATTPASSWTAANFAANAGEVTSQAEGYTGANRPAWTPTAASAGTISSQSARSSFSIVTTSSVVITGAALLSAQGRGATTGTLASATRFSASRTLNNGDTFELGYAVTLTDS